MGAAIGLVAIVISMLNLVITVRGLTRSLEASSELFQQCRAELQGRNAELDSAKERLSEVDCHATLNPRLPFGGMGIWRATYCPGNQP